MGFLGWLRATVGVVILLALVLSPAFPVGAQLISIYTDNRDEVGGNPNSVDV